MAAGYALAVILMLRLQTELLVETGFPNGIVNLIDMPVFWRGMIVYAVLTTLYLVLAHFSRGSERVVFLAATISMFFTGLLLSTIVMVL